MKRADLSNTSIIKNSDPKTLDELKATLNDIEQFLRNDKDIFYYNVMQSVSLLCKNFLNRHYEKNEEEINTLIRIYGVDECSDPYIVYLRDSDSESSFTYIADYNKLKLYNIIGLKEEECKNKDIQEFIEHLDLYSDYRSICDTEVFEVAGKYIPVRWAQQKFIEFDLYAWQKVYECYINHWSPAIMKSQKFKYIPEYPASEKMLAYYYLDFWYKR